MLAVMSDDGLSPRGAFFVFTGAVIALLLVTTATSLYHRDYRHGILLFLIASVLAFVFFRKRKIALIVTTLSSILGLGSLGFPFHPSLPGLLLLVGCAAGLYLTIRWSYKKYPYLSGKNADTVFDGDAAVAAENARIEAAARELVKKRPFGPWLFR